ncbi:hypothetical protein [Streptomyces sp. NBC_00243]|uniref:hypothetical protein n=1 Tax=Streptomyces sp. NBC_00243 TaxID=2975688 RepID=UPI003FA368ED
MQHLKVGPIDPDFDVLAVPGQDRRLIIFTAEPDSPCRTLQLLKVIGTQRMDITT